MGQEKIFFWGFDEIFLPNFRKLKNIFYKILTTQVSPEIKNDIKYNDASFKKYMMKINFKNFELISRAKNLSQLKKTRYFSTTPTSKNLH